MKQIDEKQLYDLLLTKYDKAIADGFLASVDDLRSQADVDRLVEAVKERNINAAIEALHLQDAAFEPLSNQIRFAFAESGSRATDYMPDITSASGDIVAIVRFSVRNPRAEAWLSDHSSQLITNIIDDQRTAVKQALVAGMEAGNNPRDTALGIVGRYNSQTQQREGSIIGLTAQQESYVQNARTELESGDKQALQNYLNRSMRDHRFDGLVKSAIKDEKPINPDDIQKITGRYSDRLLKLRGDTIGRTESLTALRAGKYEAYKQAIETGSLQDTAVKKVWASAGDNRVRDSHAELDGIETDNIDEPFISPSGEEMMYPGDTSMGAGPEEIINCRCDVNYVVDFLADIGKEKVGITANPLGEDG